MLRPRLVRPLKFDPPPDGVVHLGASSAVQLINQTLYVVADDELHLAVIDERGLGAARWLRLLPGALPEDERARKAQKPDFEALLHLPSRRCLVALPSASTGARMTVAIVALHEDGQPTGQVQRSDLRAFYEAFAFAERNFEGAAVLGDRLFLLQRGSLAAPDNFLCELSLSDFWRAVEGDTQRAPPYVRHDIALPPLHGALTTPTDLIPLDADRFVFTAAAEASPNAYEDGVTMGSLVGVMTARGEIVALHEVEGRGMKLEGVTIASRGAALRLLLVADQDRRGSGGELLELELPL